MCTPPQHPTYMAVFTSFVAKKKMLKSANDVSGGHLLSLTSHRPFQRRHMATLSKAVSTLWIASCRALMPASKKPTETDLKLYKAVFATNDECVYCGDVATAVDHFRPVVCKNGVPSGYCDDTWNLVPCCTTCNSSKGNRPWRAFMVRKTGKTPLARGVHPETHRKRLLRLQSFEVLGKKRAQRWCVNEHKSSILALRKTMLTTVHGHSGRIRKLHDMLAANRETGAISASSQTLRGRPPRVRGPVVTSADSLPASRHLVRLRNRPARFATHVAARN